MVAVVAFPQPIASAPLDALRRALREARSPLADAPLEPLTDKGLAHHHVRLVGRSSPAYRRETRMTSTPMRATTTSLSPSRK